MATDGLRIPDLSVTPPSRRTLWLMVGVLLFFLIANFVLRAHLEQAKTFLWDYFSVAYADTLDKVYAKPWYRLLLPIEEWTGSWTSTSLALLPPLTKLTGSYPRVYLLLNALFVSTAFFTSWIAFRSRIFTITFTACAAFTTYNYHVYACTGSVNQYFIVSYLLWLLACQYRLFTTDGPKRGWWIGWSAAFVLFVLSYEGWLSYVVWTWLMAPFAILTARKYGRSDQARLAATLLVVVTLTAGAYVLVKRDYGYGQTSGSESDVVFNYDDKMLAFEDIVSNFFTIFYTVVTNYTPPALVTSNSLQTHTPAELIAAQNGYHTNQSHLVPYNHLFLWRFYAGVAATLFVGVLIWLLRNTWQNPTRERFVILALMLMTLTGSPTHMLVKWRPMNVEPFISYHFFFGVIGLSLLLAYGTYLAATRLTSRRWAAVLIGLVWFDIGYCALARPALLNRMCSEVQMGTYPDPWKTLTEKVF